MDLNSHNLSKEVTQHPWIKTIKENFSKRIKYAHNSIRNPKYPAKTIKKKQQPGSDRAQFTIIGDRVTKEFIFCSNLARGLHKYRWKNFDAPKIRGVSTIEWSDVWNHLKVRFGAEAHCLQSSVAVLLNDNIIGGEKEMKELVESKYIFHLCLDYYNEGIAQFARFVTSTGRPFAYMHISINDKHVGTLIFMLYADVVPYTCENFLRLCKETKGGYGGTPVHRIVKDGWIQCGGFGLKSTPLSCENFDITLDKRGVLAMANDGRDVDCSTQFFVLLQPALWMTHKYVAFGQLVEGEATLKEIENVKTWNESPSSKIILYRCGILNMECHDIMINKGATEYIDGHIEDMTDFCDRLWAYILHLVFLEAQMRELERLRGQGGEGAESVSEDDAIHPTQRFKKEDIEKQLKNNQGQRSSAKENNESVVDVKVPTSTLVKFNSEVLEKQLKNSQESAEENNEYQQAEEEYQHQSLQSSSLVVRPQKPFYIPLTDVPYLGDADSDFNMTRFVKGDYCHESDLEKPTDKNKAPLMFPSEILMQFEQASAVSSECSLSNEDEAETVGLYIRENSDKVSFAGEVIRGIAKVKKTPETLNLFAGIRPEDRRKSDLITDDKLRRLRLASVDLREKEARMAARRVSINAPQRTAAKVKRRQTGFVRKQDLEKVNFITNESSDDDDDNLESRKSVRLSPVAVIESEHSAILPQQIHRRPTGFIRVADFPKDNDSEINSIEDEQKSPASSALEIDTDTPKQNIRASNLSDVFHARKPSALVRLYNELDVLNDEGPTLKNYTPYNEIQPKNILLTTLKHRINSNESNRMKFTRHSLLSKDDETIDHLLSLQHGKAITRKISSDYVKTIEKVEHEIENSIRSIEFAKSRPTISVSEYRLKNRKYHEGLQQMSNQLHTVMKPVVNFDVRPSTDSLNVAETRVKYSPDVK